MPGVIFRGEAKYSITMDKVKVVGRLTDYNFRWHVRVGGKVSHSPSLGRQLLYSVLFEVILEEEPSTASQVRVQSFRGLKTSLPDCKHLVNNMLVRTQDQWGKTLIQHIRRYEEERGKG